MGDVEAFRIVNKPFVRCLRGTWLLGMRLLTVMHSKGLLIWPYHCLKK
uniref:Uncharacterized protein n=1 Tax=Rhizophora mucronata TaxID=61149 RepID=A0A2P2NHJ3_RHIMU